MQVLTEHDIQAVSGGLDSNQCLYLISMATQAATICAYTGLFVLLGGKMPSGFAQEKILIPLINIAGYAIGSELGNQIKSRYWTNQMNVEQGGA